MTRITTLAHLAVCKDPPPLRVWAMTMAVLGAFFGAPSSKQLVSARLPGIERRTVR